MRPPIPYFRAMVIDIAAKVIGFLVVLSENDVWFLEKETKMNKKNEIHAHFLLKKRTVRYEYFFTMKIKINIDLLQQIAYLYACKEKNVIIFYFIFFNSLCKDKNIPKICWSEHLFRLIWFIFSKAAVLIAADLVFQTLQ